MKKILMSLLLLLVFSLTACANQADQKISETSLGQRNETDSSQAISQSNEDIRLKLTVEGREVVIRLYDHPVSRDLLTLLPLTLNFKDYVQEEKISYLPRELVREEVEGNSGRQDDFTYFAPWGNLAIFYKGKHPGGNGLIILGTIESGKEVFSTLNFDFTGTLERIH